MRVNHLSMRIEHAGSSNETGLMLNRGSEEASVLTSSIYFSYRSLWLPWFFQKTARGPAVAPMGTPDYYQGGIVSLRKMRLLLAAIAVASGLTVAGLQGQEAQGEMVRRAKSKVPAVYPELAKKMNLAGTVKVEVVVSANGIVKDAKVVGGHAVRANAALDAVKKWRFEP